MACGQPNSQRNRAAKRDQIMSLLASIAGQPFAEVNLASDRDCGTDLVLRAWISRRDFQAQWRTSGTPNRADVILHGSSKANSSSFATCSHPGYAPHVHSLINRDITLKTGDPLSPVEEMDIQRTALRSGHFRAREYRNRKSRRNRRSTNMSCITSMKPIGTT